MAAFESQDDKFTKTWEGPPGFGRWFAVVNNQPLGKRFILTAMAFFTLGGLLALLMRIQLAVSNNTFLGPDAYNKLFSMHGSTMMFLFVVPFLEGLALYLIPMMIGSRDVAFPRLTAFGYWCYLFGGILFYVSFFMGTVPDSGWFSYTPLSGPKYAGLGMDFWVLGLGLVEIAGITAGIEIVATILKMRAPGMHLSRMPLFIWSILVAGCMILVAFTTLLTATFMLELDRTLMTRFFDPERGGSSLLWQHLFWFFGHPEVYIMFIPATGIVSTILSVYTRRPVAGYKYVVVALILTGFVSFGLWTHHMFATGLPEFAMSFFTAASLMIAVASGIQIFAWLATLWGSRPDFKVPLLYILGFIFLFVAGGITGVMVAVLPFDLQVHDTFFVVAHFHYVLIGGVVFPIFAALHYWFPKITGKMPSERIGKWSFWLTFVGFNLTFFPMHIMGFFGMPRRVYTYPSSLGLDGYNILATGSAFLMAAGFILFVYNFYISVRKGLPAGSDPWKSGTLEWSISSPPPVYSYHALPYAKGTYALWDKDKNEEPSAETQKVLSTMTGAPAEWRATLCTDVLTARPQAIQPLPGPSYMPLIAALGLLMASVGILARGYFLAIAAAVVALVALLQWLWTPNERFKLLAESKLPEESGLPIFATGNKAIGWWGAVFALTTIAVAFLTLYFSYFYIRLYSAAWPQDNLPRPELLLPSLFYAVLVCSAFFYWKAGKYQEIQYLGKVKSYLLGAFACGVVFMGFLVREVNTQIFGPDTNAYASLFFVIQFVLIALTFVCVALTGGVIWRAKGPAKVASLALPLQFQIASYFWYFLLSVAASVFLVLYISPYLFGVG